MKSLVQRGQFALGLLAAIVGLALPAELFLRQFPPPELDLYRGDRSLRSGGLEPNRDLVVGYRSWEEFRVENASDLAPWLAEGQRPEARPTWVFIGNSFAHGAGMLADQVQTEKADRYVLTLHRTDPLPIRFAQVDALLEQRARVERFFVPLATVDLLAVGRQPLSTVEINSSGAFGYRPRLPGGPSGWLVEHSILAAMAWFRTGAHRGNRTFDGRELDLRIGEPLFSDLLTLFAGLARRTRKSEIPLTIVLIPSHSQVVRGVSDGFQETMRTILLPLGYDVFDPLPLLRGQPNRGQLFLPDKHFNPSTNRLLAAALIEHVRATNGTIAQ